MSIMKKAIMFSGQGAQKQGMGAEIYEKSARARKIFDIAGDEIKRLCLEGTDEELSLTINTQPCVFTVTMAKWADFIHENDEDIAALAGFSLGEYSALCASGVFGKDEYGFMMGLDLVKKRAKFMDDAANENAGGMVAVLGLHHSRVREEIAEFEGLEIVNYNCPGQVVVAGEIDKINMFIDKLNNNSIKNAKLAVSGAFHSRMMSGVVDKLRGEIAKMQLFEFQIPVVSNVTGRFYESLDTLRELLPEQAAHSVHWQRGMEFLLDIGVDEFEEIGVGSTLTSFLRRIKSERNND
jgi:[acyl-carrier-protein] S-malonyltransferase